MFKYILTSLISLLFGALIMRACHPNKVERVVINKTITDTLIKQVKVMQKAKEVIKIIHYTTLKKEVDTLHTIDTTASELVFKLLSEVNKRDSIQVIDSMKIDILTKINELQCKQLDEAVAINDSLINQIDKKNTKTMSFKKVINTSQKVLILILGVFIGRL